MAHAMESWDDDGELQGDIFTTSLSTVKTSFSSRMSVRSDSNAGDDDWNLNITPNDANSSAQAISAAHQAGIPLPDNVPSSALLGGSIKRLGKKQSQKSVLDDWADDLEFELAGTSELKVKPQQTTNMESFVDDSEDFTDWAEGSLGVRFGGTRRASNHRESSTSAMSPSMGSCMTIESEDDGLDGLVIPSDHHNFEAALKRVERGAIEEHRSPHTSASLRPPPHDAPDPAEPQRDDFLSGLDIGPGEVFDLRKRTLHRNLKPAWKSSSKPAEPSRVLTTLTFTDKAASTKIPRPVPTKTPRLEPVLESGSTNVTRPRRQPELVTPGSAAQMLRSKRSTPGLRNQPQVQTKPPTVPFLPAGIANAHSHHVRSKTSIQNIRRDSDPTRTHSPPPRAASRLSQSYVTETPTRARHNITSSAVLRDVAPKRPVTRPLRRRNFGDGTELDVFDDLPTSDAKESKFIKQPTLRGPNKGLRAQTSQTKLPLRNRVGPSTPASAPAPAPAPAIRSPTMSGNLPRFARDTAASRIAREQKLGNSRGKNDGPLGGRVNWSAQVAARTPHTSPIASRPGGKGPQLVNSMGKENVRQFQDDAAKKGMHWNAAMCRWEGNDAVLLSFDNAPAMSPPRPALIANVSGAQGVQVVAGMVFDPQKMCWLKMGKQADEARSTSMNDEDDEDDPFGGIEDLKETVQGEGVAGRRGAAVGGEWLVGEEFDVGPEFIRRQREEETTWRARVSAWFGPGREGDGEGYKWALREIAATAIPS